MLEPKGLFSTSQKSDLSELAHVKARFITALEQVSRLCNSGEVDKAYRVTQSLFEQMSILPTEDRAGCDLKKQICSTYAELATRVGDYPAAINGFDRLITESHAGQSVLTEEIRFAQMKIVILQFLQQNYPEYEKALELYDSNPNNQDDIGQLPLLALKAANLERQRLTKLFEAMRESLDEKLFRLNDRDFHAVIEQLYEVIQIVGMTKNYGTGIALGRSLLTALEQGRRNVNHVEIYLDVLMVTATLEYFTGNEDEASYLIDQLNQSLDELPLEDHARITFAESSITLLKKLGRFHEALIMCEEQCNRTLDDLDFNSHFTFATTYAQLLFLTGMREKAHHEVSVSLNRIEQLLPHHLLVAIRNCDTDQVTNLLTRASEDSVVERDYELHDLLVHYRQLQEISLRFQVAEQESPNTPPSTNILRTMLAVLGEPQNTADEIEYFQDVKEDSNPDSLRKYLHAVEANFEINPEQSFNSVYHLLRIAVIRTRLDGSEAGASAFKEANAMYQRLTQGEALSGAPLINLLRGHYYMEREEFTQALAPLIDAQQAIENANQQLSSIGVEIYRCAMECYRQIGNEDAAAEFSELHEQALAGLKRISDS